MWSIHAMEYYSAIKGMKYQNSLVVLQWIGICLSMQEFNPWSGKIHMLWTDMPCATAAEPSSRTCELQLLKPASPGVSTLQLLNSVHLESAPQQANPP